MDQKVELKGKISEVCTIWQLRRNFIILMLLLGSNSFCYFLLNFQMKYVTGNLITNTLASQSGELIADCISGLIYTLVGPKMGFSISYIFSILGSVLLLKFWTNTSTILYFIIMAKFGISSAFNMSFIASVQLIPTIFAASVFGYCNVVARTVTMMSSIVAEQEYPTPLVISISTALLAAIASLFIV